MNILLLNIFSVPPEKNYRGSTGEELESCDVLCTSEKGVKYFGVRVPFSNHGLLYAYPCIYWYRLLMTQQFRPDASVLIRTKGAQGGNLYLFTDQTMHRCFLPIDEPSHLHILLSHLCFILCCGRFGMQFFVFTSLSFSAIHI